MVDAGDSGQKKTKFRPWHLFDLLEFVFYAALGLAPVVGILLGLWHVARDARSPLFAVGLVLSALVVLAFVIRDIARKRLGGVSKALLICWGLGTAYVFFSLQFPAK